VQCGPLVSKSSWILSFGVASTVGWDAGLIG
jgi:hypothetical protein